MIKNIFLSAFFLLTHTSSYSQEGFTLFTDYKIKSLSDLKKHVPYVCYCTDTTNTKSHMRVYFFKEEKLTSQFKTSHMKLNESYWFRLLQSIPLSAQFTITIYYFSKDVLQGSGIYEYGRLTVAEGELKE